MILALFNTEKVIDCFRVLMCSIFADYHILAFQGASVLEKLLCRRKYFTSEFPPHEVSFIRIFFWFVSHYRSKTTHCSLERLAIIFLIYLGLCCLSLVVFGFEITYHKKNFDYFEKIKNYASRKFLANIN